MSQHTARVVWNRSAEGMDARTYSRVHLWSFDGGTTVRASAAAGGPVPADAVSPDTVDPEEAVVAALAACHMLFFLALAAKRGLVVDRYEDAPHGTLETREGRAWLTTITLAPRVTWHGEPPAAAVVDELHHQAHARCYIANSLRSEVVIKPAAA